MVPLDRGKWPASRHDLFSLGKGAPSSRNIGGLLSPRSGVDALEKREISRAELEAKILGHPNSNRSRYID
jgi:hypothetical protein